MNKKQMMKRMIGLSLLAGLFLPIVANADSYTVKSGDTLSAIAKEKNTTVDAIAKKNAPPVTAILANNCISTGSILWCIPVIVRGAYINPNTAPPRKPKVL